MYLTAAFSNVSTKIEPAICLTSSRIWVMKHFKPLLISYILPVVAALLVVFGCKTQASRNMVCTHPYALCTSAMCVPQPGDQTKAVCFCDVEKGMSMSSASCKKLQPSTDANGIQTVYSTFSLEQFKSGKKSLRCPSGTPWTWCLNKRCTVDPSNPKKAVCLCDVMRTGEWTTLGGNCDTSTCQTAYWSGASLNDLKEANIFMTKALGLEQSPAKWCQAVHP